MMRKLYTLGINAYMLGIRLAALTNPKARKWIDGRRQQDLKKITLVGRPVWIHCASVGEFEQGRPIMEWLKAKHPELPIVLSFFSPSGYEMRKGYPLADAVLYLPADLPKAIVPFLKAIDPRAAIFVKYEIWHNCLHMLEQSAVPTFLISAKFRPEQVYFSPWGKWFASTLKVFRHIFTQDLESSLLLKSIRIEDVSVSGDTRFDRVIQIASDSQQITGMDAFKAGQPLLIAGSTWPADEEKLVQWYHKQGQKSGWKLIIVPHEIDEKHLGSLQHLIPQAVRYSAPGWQNAQVVIFDTMGLLNRLYAHADIAYVGGGFGAGIHNVLEAAVYGCPVVFGPNHKKFGEAIGLIESGGAFGVADATGLYKALNMLCKNPQERDQIGQAAAQFVQRGAGATGHIAKALSESLSL